MSGKHIRVQKRCGMKAPHNNDYFAGATVNRAAQKWLDEHEPEMKRKNRMSREAMKKRREAMEVDLDV